jgi:hypothetical protein
LRAQDALRTAVQGDQAYLSRNSTNYVPEQYKLRAGPVEFQANVGYALEWNDNVFFQQEHRESDFINIPSLNIFGVWPVSDKSRISFGVGMSYLAYVNHSELDSFVITPNSELAWDIHIKDCIVTLYDRFTYSQDVLTVPTINSGTGEFPRIENTGGVRMRWYPDRYVFELGYGHYNFLPVSSASPTFDYLTRNAEQFFARAGYRIAEATTIGLESSTSFTDYQQPIQSDNVNVSVGPYLEWQVTEAWHASLRGGWVWYSFEDSLSQPTGGTVDSWYVGLYTDHRLTDHIRHGVSLVRDIEQAFNRGSDYIENLNATYYVSWDFHRGATLTGNFTYTYNNEPNGGVSSIYNLYGAGVGLLLRPLDHLNVGLNYSFAIRDSNVPNNGYTQNLVTLSVIYQF